MLNRRKQVKIFKSNNLQTVEDEVNTWTATHNYLHYKIHKLIICNGLFLVMVEYTQYHTYSANANH